MYFSALLLAFLPSLLAQPGRFGLPACSGPDQELAVRTSFLLCHSSSLKIPLWTAYELTPQNLVTVAVRAKHFRHDSQLSGTGAYDSDYRNSGYSRGHMVPAAAAAWSESAIRDTFLLSNTVPQRQSVNNGKWRTLENRVRRIAESSDAVYVFSGPILSGEIEFIGEGRVAVPTFTFKVVLAIRGDHKTMYAAIVPNSPTNQPLESYAVPVQEVERRTGLDFFSAMEASEQHRLESARNGLPVLP